MQIHEKIKVIRDSKKITQSEMADGLGITQKAYSKMENGETKITIDRLPLIAEILDVDITELIKSENQFITIYQLNTTKDESKNVIKLTTASETIEVLKERIAGLEREKELLERENTLLRENNRLLNEKFSVNGL